MRKVTAAAGLFGPLLFAAAVTTLTVAQYGFMLSLGWDPLRAPTFDWPSGLSLGPLGWLMTGTFLISGALMSLFAFGLRMDLQNRSGQIGSALMLAAGLAMMGLAFTTDPTIRSTLATWHGRLHDLSFVLLGLTLIPALTILGFAFRQNKRLRHLSVYTWITAALAIPTFALKGIVFYIFLLAVLAWSELTALQLHQGTLPR
jgi:hypothetical protein